MHTNFEQKYPKTAIVIGQKEQRQDSIKKINDAVWFAADPKTYIIKESIFFHRFWVKIYKLNLFV